MSRSHTQVAAAIAALVIAGSTLDRALADSGPPAKQAHASRAESTGVLTGLVVGAAAAGPIGAIAGAAGGGWLGDRAHRQEQRARALTADIKDQLSQRQRLSAEIERLNTALAHLDTELAGLRANSLPLDELAANVQFRTRDTALQVTDQDYLRKLGSLLAQRTDRPVYVTGFADARGVVGFNFELSTARAEAVADALVEGGLARTQLIVQGVGAQANSECLVDGDHCAFERRATVRMTPSDADSGEDLLVQVMP
jgi:outer membrane protein OmpA-like peptidoglycan-associated protein